MIRGLDLGDVAFGLLADTDGLDRALGKLRAFGDVVNKTAKSTEDGAAQTTAAFIRQEKAITAAYQKTLDLNAALRQAGAPASMLADTTNTFRSLTTALTKGELDALKFARAQEQIAARLGDSKRALQAFQDQQAKSTSIENAISRAQTKVTNTAGAFERAGAPSSFIDTNASAYNAYEASMRASKGNAAAMATAQREFNTTLSQTDQEYKKWAADLRLIEQLQAQINTLSRTGSRVGVPGVGGSVSGFNTQLDALKKELAAGGSSGASATLSNLRKEMAATEAQIANATNTAGKWSFVMRDLERASILAMGPLSGIGARMAVLSALFESTTVKNALFVAGIAGTTTVLALLAAESIKTTMKFQQWNAQMITASGAQTLVAEDMKFVIQQSNKFGQSIESTIPAYTKFAASARLSGLAVEDIRKTFTAFMTAGAANHWGIDQTSNAFLALEQIMSKGTVQTEEVKKQLGNVLPGAFELAAASVHKTTSEFQQLLKSGSLLSTEFMPKFAALVELVNRAAAAQGMQSLQSDLARAHNSLDLLYKGFDDNIHASKAFQAIVKSTISVLDGLTANVDKIIPSIAGITAFFIGLSSPTILAGVLSLAAGIRVLTLRILEGEAAALLFTAPWAGVAALLARVALGAGAAAGAYALFNQKTDAAIVSSQEYAKTLELTAETFKGVGEIQKSVHDRIMKAAGERLKAINAELAAQQALLQAQKEAIKPSMLIPGVGFVKSKDTDETKEIQAKIDTFTKARQDIQNALADFNKITVVPDPSNGPRADSHLKVLINDTQKLINSIQELKTAQDVLKAGGKVDDEEITHAKALEKAQDFVEKIDVASNRGALAAMLKNAGFQGKNLVEQFTSLYELQGKLQGENKSFTKQNEAIASVQAKINEETDKYNALVDTSDKKQGAIAKTMATIDEYLKKNNVNTGTRIALEEKLRAVLNAEEGQNKRIDDDKKLIETNKAIDAYLGNHKAAVEEVNKKYDDMTIAVLKANYTAQEQAVKTAAIEQMRGKDLFKAAENANENLKTIHDALVNVGRDGAKSLIDMFKGVDGAAGKFFQNIFDKLEETLVQLLIIKPIMEKMFGNMFTGGTSGTDNNGFLGNALGKLFSFGGSGGGGGGGDVVDAASEIFTISHTGLSGSGVGNASRILPSSMLAGAPRLHSGLQSDEFPAILQRGEDVISRSQKAAMAQKSSKGGIHYHQYNTFQFASPQDVKTQAQLGAKVGMSTQHHLKRNS